MDSNDFKLVQQLVGWTNGQVAERLGVSEVAVEKWRAGARTIAPMVARQFLVVAGKIVGERMRQYSAINRKYR